MTKSRAFSLYDIEEFLREAGAEKINERAVVSLEHELESMAKELVNEAQVYANYAGRTKLITGQDISLAKDRGRNGPVMMSAKVKGKRRAQTKPNIIEVLSP